MKTTARRPKDPDLILTTEDRVKFLFGKFLVFLRRAFFIIIGLFFLLLFLGILFYIVRTVAVVIIPESSGFLVRFIANPTRTWNENIFALLVITFTGFSLYHFKRKAKIYYGIVEIIFGMSYSWSVILKTKVIGSSELITIVASVYLIVRGFDNFYTGMSEKRALNTKKKTRDYIPF